MIKQLYINILLIYLFQVMYKNFLNNFLDDTEIHCDLSFGKKSSANINYKTYVRDCK